MPTETGCCGGVTLPDHLSQLALEILDRQVAHPVAGGVHVGDVAGQHDMSCLAELDRLLQDRNRRRSEQGRVHDQPISGSSGRARKVSVTQPTCQTGYADARWRNTPVTRAFPNLQVRLHLRFLILFTASPGSRTVAGSRSAVSRRPANSADSLSGFPEPRFETRGMADG